MAGGGKGYPFGSPESPLLASRVVWANRTGVDEVPVSPAVEAESLPETLVPNLRGQP